LQLIQKSNFILNEILSFLTESISLRPHFKLSTLLYKQHFGFKNSMAKFLKRR